jgi:hypothetical protein
MGDVLPLRKILKRRDRRWPKKPRPKLTEKTGLDFSHWIEWVNKSSYKIDERNGYDPTENVAIWNTIRKLKTKHNLTEEEADLAIALYERWKENEQRKLEQENTQAG